jgi:ribosomal protein S1
MYCVLCLTAEKSALISILMQNKSISGEAFVWPEFNSESERIKAYSKRYANMSIVEAFEHAYGITIGQVKEGANNTPSEIKVGDEIMLNILSITKNHVEFDAANYKAQILSSVNLHKYDRFKHNLPTDPIKVQVMDVQKDRVTVDPLAPVVNDYLNPILRNKNVQKVIGNPQSVRVKNLQLTKGGFTGKAVLPTVSQFVGEEYTVDVFIPGSQIVLNITDNFEQFVGKEVDAFIINYMNKPGSNALSLVASAKELIKFRGECKLIELFKSWCEESEAWKKNLTSKYQGRVTGVINSSKKCGVFVEIPALDMTGLVPVEPDQLVNYKADSFVWVQLTGFDEEKKYNPITKQMEHVDPYVIEDNCLVRCNLKPVLSFVEA